jgi:putative flippase GtrA
VIDTPETQQLERIEATESTNYVSSFPDKHISNLRRSRWSRFFKQLIRFGLVGGLNTFVDLLVLNALLLLFPATNTLTLLTYNSIAYSLGAINSFLLNKYWTFGHRKPISRKEVVRFVITTMCSIAVSNALIWLASEILHPLHINSLLWANASKVFAIFGTVFVSFLGMRLWVFVNKPHEA